MDLNFALCGRFSCWFEWFVLVLYCGFLVVLVLLVCLPLRLVSAMLLRDCGLGYCLFVDWPVLFDCVCDCFGGG